MSPKTVEAVVDVGCRSSIVPGRREEKQVAGELSFGRFASSCSSERLNCVLSVYRSLSSLWPPDDRPGRPLREAPTPAITTKTLAANDEVRCDCTFADDGNVS